MAKRSDRSVGQRAEALKQHPSTHPNWYQFGLVLVLVGSLMIRLPLLGGATGTQRRGVCLRCSVDGSGRCAVP